jgi:hypothetical protein
VDRRTVGLPFNNAKRSTERLELTARRVTRRSGVTSANS